MKLILLSREPKGSHKLYDVHGRNLSGEKRIVSEMVPLLRILALRLQIILKTLIHNHDVVVSRKATKVAGCGWWPFIH